MEDLNWNPETQTVQELVIELERLIDEGIRIDMSDLPIADEFCNRLAIQGPQLINTDKCAVDETYPVWTVDHKGNALVGDDAKSFEHIDDVPEL